MLTMMGHNGYGSHKLLEERGIIRKDCLTMTVFREPVARSISAYYYHGSQRGLGLNVDVFQRCLNGTLPLEAFRSHKSRSQSIEDKNQAIMSKCPQYGNYAVSLFSGRWQCVTDKFVHKTGSQCLSAAELSALDDAAPLEGKQSQNGDLTFPTESGLPSSEDLESAKRNLCKIDIVGQLDDLVESLKLMTALITGSHSPQYYNGTESQIQKHGKREKYRDGDFSNEHFEILSEATQLDRELFRFSKSVYEAQRLALQDALSLLGG